MFIEETIKTAKSNRMSTTVVLDYVDPSLAAKTFFSDDTAVVSFDEHTNLHIHIKKEQAVLLLEWARNLVKAFDDKDNNA